MKIEPQMEHRWNTARSASGTKSILFRVFRVFRGYRPSSDSEEVTTKNRKYTKLFDETIIHSFRRLSQKRSTYLFLFQLLLRLGDLLPLFVGHFRITQVE